MKSLEKIVQTLIINGSLTFPPGLFYGKTGIAIFFLHYARHTGNELFKNYAMDLIEMIQNQIDDTFPARYDTGIAGIGVGLEYLLQNGLLEAEDSDVFEDLDERMYRAAMYESYSNLGLQEGLTGWGRYFIYRMQGNGHNNNKLHEALTHIANKISNRILENTVHENEKPDVYRFIHDLTILPDDTRKFHNTLQHCNMWNCINQSDIQKTFPYLGDLQRLCVCQYYFNIDLTEEIEQEWKKWEETSNNSLMDMGLLKGWSTEGMLHLTFFHNQDISWINLL